MGVELGGLVLEADVIDVHGVPRPDDVEALVIGLLDIRAALEALEQRAFVAGGNGDEDAGRKRGDEQQQEQPAEPERQQMLIDPIDRSGIGLADREDKRLKTLFTERSRSDPQLGSHLYYGLLAALDMGGESAPGRRWQAVGAAGPPPAPAAGPVAAPGLL